MSNYLTIAAGLFQLAFGRLDIRPLEGGSGVPNRLLTKMMPAEHYCVKSSRILLGRYQLTDTSGQQWSLDAEILPHGWPAIGARPVVCQ